MGWCGWPGGGSTWRVKTFNAGDMAMLEGVPSGIDLVSYRYLTNVHEQLETAIMTMAMPENWDLGAIFLQLYFFSEMADTDPVNWQWWAFARNDGEAETVGLTFRNAFKAPLIANVIYITPEINFVPENQSGSNKPGDLVTIGLFRDTDLVNPGRVATVKVRMRYRIT